PDEHVAIEPEKSDTFQDLFNTVANDLAIHRSRLHPSEIEEIRRIAELRFAAEMVPDVYSRYLAPDRQGRFSITHLPAADDPMMERVRSIRTRDEMLVDAINGYYETYYRDLWLPYANWR